ncbi:MAG: hypothetical protein U0694_00270 [Anaerolineae bacterium]
MICPSHVPAGRPAPFMMYQNAMRLNVYPMAAVVKVGDTMPDIEEGLSAGPGQLPSANRAMNWA